jgi:hypothetical protein
MQQQSTGKELVLTRIVTAEEARQGQLMRYVLSFGLLGVIFVSAMMLVILAS